MLVLAPLALPSAASAGTCQAPPGTSAIDQYCEALPSPGTGGSGHHKHSKPVSNSTSKQLAQQGAAGQAVLNLANSSGDANSNAAPAPATSKPVRHHHRRHHRNSAGGTSTPAAPVTPKPVSSSLPAPSSNPLSAVGSAIGTGSSAGAVFIWILVALAAVMGATAFIGHRRRARES